MTVALPAGLLPRLLLGRASTTEQKVITPPELTDEHRAARPPARWNWWLPPWVLALALCLITLNATAWVAINVFDRLPHVEDDVTFLFQAQTIASGRLFAEPPPRPEFFDIPFIVVREGKWFGKYPPGYPAVLALGVLTGAPWLLNPIVGALVVGLTFLAGRRFYGPGIGLLAAGLLVTSPFFLLQAGSFMSHTVTLGWTMLFLLGFAAARSRGSPWLGLTAGLAIGMLFLSRPLTAVGVGFPFLVWVALDLLRDRRALRYALPILAGFLPFAAFVLIYNRLTTGSPLHFAYELWWPYDRIGFGPGRGPGETGHTLESGWWIVKFNLAALGGYLFGWPRWLSLVPAILATSLALGRIVWRDAESAPAGLGWSAKLRAPTTQSWDLLLLGMVVGLIGVHIAYWTAGQMYGPRYYFEAIGALVLLSARGIDQFTTGFRYLLRAAVPNRPRVWSLASGLVALGLATLILSNFTGFAPREFDRYTGWYNINGSGVRRVEQADLHNALVFVPYREWTDYAPFFSQHGPALDGDIVYAIDHGGANQELMRYYPDRSYYLYSDGRLVPLPRS